MPGNVKMGVSTEPDPDPIPYLCVSNDMKRQDMSKPYDAKKSVWIPAEGGGFTEGLLQSDDGKKAVVMIGHEKRTCKSDQYNPVNPPKFEKCEDMANLTYLNEASVLWNLKSRYQAKLIYTYSGLFCVVVNPYRRFPIYTQTAIKMYIGKRRNEVPPHLFAISDTAYRNVLKTGANQSILVTGESGAGKTENTKKVIAYFALVGARESSKKGVKKASLEEQIVETNPILESFGNAKTARNDNSSRFGKFIRIHFNLKGKLSGCDIETYLLEKSRITFQQEVERSYHIFYQMMQKAVPHLKKMCHLSDDIYDYHFVSQGKTMVPSIDDNEDLEFTQNAFNVLGFSEQETNDIYKIVACVMHMGELKFKQKGREEQCEPDAPKNSKNVGSLAGVDHEQLMRAFCKPKIKVGTEWVTKGQNIDQAFQSVAAIARGLYDRVFRFLVEVCNRTLVDPSMKKVSFIGVLDIAGFEIFAYNGFEQICINFCNEKLQQFFNHHTFVLEQEEYINEGIDWAMVDFGMDLQQCINLFEKPMGLLAILEEESLFPKATDKSFEDKLKTNHLGKSPNFSKPSTKSDKNAHFAIVHYAGTVSYNVTGWLEKNKDPLNDTVVEVFKTGSNKLVVHIFADHPGQNPDHDDASKGGKEGKHGRKAKGGGGKTVSSFYKSQLDSLMNTLYATEPHFIRCIVPNGVKQAGEIDSPMVLHQLNCNGVLEGIRICMRGFPNRMTFKEFVIRYRIVEVKEITKSGVTDPKKMTEMICNARVEPEKFRVGHTKIFFRAGVLGNLEEVRDEIVMKLVTYIQGACHGHMSRKEYARRKSQREMIKVLQRTFRQYLRLRHWPWFSIIQKTRPLIGMVNIEEEIKILEDVANKAISEAESETKEKKRLEEENLRLQEEKDALMKQLESEQGDLSQYQERQAKLSTQHADLEVQFAEAKNKLRTESERHQMLLGERRNVEGELSTTKGEISELGERISKAESERTNRDHTIRTVSDEISSLDDAIAKLNKEKKYFQENSSKAAEELQNAEDKVSHLNMVKNKLEQTLDDLEDALEREKRNKGDSEKARRKVEGDLTISQELVGELERNKKELEGVISRREKDISEMTSKMEDEQSQAAKQQKHIKELNNRVEEWEEELEAERQARAKSERQKTELIKELEELSDRLEEASGATAAQIELNKKRENELGRMRKELEEAAIQREATMLSLKKKHQDAIGEMTEQIEQLGKLKARAESERQSIIMQTNDLKAAHDHVVSEKATAEKNSKDLQGQYADISKRMTTAGLQLQDMDMGNRKAISENSDLTRQLNEVEANIAIMQKMKIQLSNQLEEAKRMCDEESRERQSLLGRYRNLEHEYDGNMMAFNEELAAKEDLARMCQKAVSDANHWRLKYEKDGIAKIEELENTKLKLQARLAECESTMGNLNSKLSQLEKSKAKLRQDIEEVGAQVDQATVQYGQLEKKIRQFETIIGEWKRKADGLAGELDMSQKECRGISSELFRVKNGYEETANHLADSKRENANLSDEIKDIMEQISEGGRSIHEIEKQRKRLEVEKRELQAALEEAEATLEQEENKFMRAQLELGQVQQEMERRLTEKEEEFVAIKRSHQKQVDQLQAAYEVECKAKADAQRTKKKLEADIQELEAALEHANYVARNNQQTYDKYQNSIRNGQQRLDDEQKGRSMAREHLLNMDRKTHNLQNCLEEARTLLDQTDRARRAAEQELSDCQENINDLGAQNQSIAANKRHVEADLENIKQDLDEAGTEARIVEEKAKMAMMDAAKLADELRVEQDNTTRAENERRMMDSQLKELQARLDDAEMNALKNGKKAAQKMEARIRELENELDGEQRRLGDSTKNLKKSERRIKEMEFQAVEDRKQHDHMQDLAEKLQQKLRYFKKQIEEAEEIAAVNLAKFRKAQTDLEQAEERADLSEQAMVKVRAIGRARGETPLPGQTMF